MPSLEAIRLLKKSRREWKAKELIHLDWIRELEASWIRLRKGLERIDWREIWMKWNWIVLMTIMNRK
jgi:hypothetical protein